MSDSDNNNNSNKPLWRDIRGVGLPATHKDIREAAPRGFIPARDYSYISTEPREKSALLPVTAPRCGRCGLTADRHWPNNWYCHFCLEEVKAPMNPNAMIQSDKIEGAYLGAALSDPRGDTICPKCAVSRLPRADNQGFECPKCGSTWNVPGVRRVSPTNGF